MHIEILGGSHTKQQRHAEVYAIHAFNAANELGMLTALQELPTRLPVSLQNAMLHRPAASATASESELVPVTKQAVQATVSAFGLNEDQALALQKVGPWFDHSAASEVSSSSHALRLHSCDAILNDCALNNVDAYTDSGP